jgi:hypothetical protein
VIVTALSTPDLADRLRTWAAGLKSTEAAVELLIAHGAWLGRTVFVDALVESFEAYDHYCKGVVSVAIVDFEGIPAFLHTFECSAGDESILRLAAAIAEVPTASSLGALLGELDGANVALLLDAIAHAAGWHERAYVHVVTGQIDPAVRP